MGPCVEDHGPWKLRIGMHGLRPVDHPRCDHLEADEEQDLPLVGDGRSHSSSKKASIASWLGMSILQGQWACPWSRLGMSHVQVGHVPLPGWGCPISRLGMSLVQVGHVPCPGWACPMSRGLGTHFGGPGTQVGGSVRPLEAEARLFGGPGAEPPGISPIWAYY